MNLILPASEVDPLTTRPFEWSDDSIVPDQWCLAEGIKIVKTNIEQRYWFKMDNNDAKITLTAITEWAKLFHLDDESIVEKKDYSTDWVAQFRRLGEWYFQIVYSNGKTQNILLVNWDN